MAELPDLTVFGGILTRKFKGRKLERVELTITKKLNVSALELQSALEGQKLKGVRREGKTLQFDFDNGLVMGLHLMLRGELVELTGSQIPRFQVAAFHFKGGGGFAVTDLQKQATLTLNPVAPVSPDALAIAEADFSALLNRKKTAIKALLMDQKVIRGIGNSYADEILYEAGISPFSPAKAIPAPTVKGLWLSLQQVLQQAINKIAEANGDTLSGELKDFLSVHRPGLKKTEKGEAIHTAKLGGRTTYFTDSQVLFG